MKKPTEATENFASLAVDRKFHLQNTARILAEGEEDIRAGRTRPVDEFLEVMSRDKRVSG